MKTNLNKWFTIRKPNKLNLGYKIIKQKICSNLANKELLAANATAWNEQNRFEKLKVDTNYSTWKIKRRI